MPAKKNTGKSKVVTCTKCEREFSGLQVKKEAATVFVHDGNVLCKDCLLEMGVTPDTTEPYQAYLDTITKMGRFGPGGSGV
jgi:hypothetical protein